MSALRWSSVARIARVLAVLVALVLPVAGTTQPVGRDVLEAAYVMNFLNYSDWPVEKLSEPDEVTLLVVGPARMVRAFRSTAEAASERGPRRITVKSVDPKRSKAWKEALVDLHQVHAVFVAVPEPKVAKAVVAAAQGLPILTIGQGGGFVEAGGMLAFLEDGDHLVFTCNIPAIVASPVTVSSRVLRIARQPGGVPHGAGLWYRADPLAWRVGP